ncbi:MAG: PfkB family carbohydrate kinase [Acidimicrobiia bacterium]|nr:PfkB family carbohydrate kinase [Acidimicrobiia bacterium]
MSGADLSILAIGESMIELNDAGDHLTSWTFAGDALNWAVAVASAYPAGRVQHLCAVGDDERSIEFAQFCGEMNVDTSISPIVADRSMGLYWISTVDGDREFRYWRSESAARAHLRSGNRILPTHHIDLVMISNITLAVAGDQATNLIDEIGQLKSQGVTVAYDTNFRRRLWPDLETARSAEAAALDLADFVHASVDDLSAVWDTTVDDYISRLMAANVQEAIVTDGANDVAIARIDSTETFNPPVVDALDTSGAGDAFFGTYVGRRLGGSTVDEAVSAAAEVCSRVVAFPGALAYRTASASGSPHTPG